MDWVIRFQSHLWICICLAVFNAADALFTHRVLLKGGKELNPLMSQLYAIDPVLFLLVKFIFSYLILAVGLVPLHRRVQWLLLLAFVVYTLVIGWHVFINIYYIK
ncbi:DUF5658 family protein [Fictibacillus nanhaiensis]|uniref:DUF5658 family protein n=1 Tax=Fictibacillus nanhaiensis TaxID=742169 RepID=UPI002E24DDF6|nr:DUF5658 family protein [Fictibacillus nanhaiensis]